VDLNRNFIKNWVYVSGCNGDYSTSHGAIAASEDETKVLRAFMNSNKPSVSQKAIYVNTHYGGGPWIHYTGTHISDYYTPLRTRILELWNQNGITPKNVGIGDFLPTASQGAASGGAAGDAQDFGYAAFTIETCSRHCIVSASSGWAPASCPCSQEPLPSPYNPPYIDGVQNQLYPLYKQVFIAMSESVSVESVTCYQCINGTNITKQFNGTVCPQDWFSEPPDCNSIPGFEMAIFISAIILLYKKKRWRL
jgi:hypothetical protein